MAQIENMSDYQASTTVDDDENTPDCSAESTSSSSFAAFAEMKMQRLEEDGFEYEILKKNFSVGMEAAGVGAAAAEVVAIHKNRHTGWNRRARFESFKIFERAVAQKCGGGTDANIGYGWYGGSKEEICDVLLHGFSGGREIVGDRNHGVGIQLFANDYSFDGAMASEADENGLRHVLLCRVILGKRELVRSGSKQTHPSSNKYDSGVDNLTNPKRIIIWSSFMNSRILPHFVVSFEAPENFKDIQRSIRASNVGSALTPPRSAWVNLNAMMNALAKVLPPSRMVLISKSCDDFRAKKISRPQLIRRVRTLAGDKLLGSIVKNINKERQQAESLLG